MKSLNLLKILPRTHPKASTVGFTIIELAIVVLIIGVLSAIAAPGWNAFISRQRTRTVNDGVFQVLRSAQSDAKSNKKSVTVTFALGTDTPEITITDKPKEILNANGEIKAGMVRLQPGKCTTDANGNCTGFHSDNPTALTFDNLGVIENENALPFVVTTAIVDGKGAKRCVIVETILGGMRTAQGDDCPTPTW
ncbi:MAG: type II secretion system protein [Okeania sp. SIO3I5]|uniref:pilus assembly FimT family protein n=1 Tax=Okeania sp. SIO3I5 TaxID=2607805 RepID=UPI0013BE16A3|nr:type II secretion system protein [Okeania sp. SIO3I5]NEQ39111.1 type II secretion system protein [Okeania sp. SIO3I5]